MEPTYRIAKWQETFEKSDSKRYKTLPWISLPTSFAGNGYQGLIDEFGDDAPALYGAWCALASFAATCPVRGTLASGRGEPVPISRIARVTGFPAAIFARLFDWAKRQEIGWLELASPTSDAQQSPEPRPSETPGDEPSVTRATPTPPSGDPPEPDPSDDRANVGLRNERNLTNLTDGRTDDACVRACDEPAAAGPAAPMRPILIDATRWEAALPVMKRIASIVDPGYQERAGGRLKPGDRELCWRVAAIALWGLGLPWLDDVLKPLSDRREPPPSRWGYFRGAMITAAKRLGHDFHQLEKMVELVPEIAEREAAKQPRRATVPA